MVVVGPLAFDLSGGNPLAWKPEQGTRIAIIPRDGGPVRWIHTEAFWAWHYANAYEDGDLIHLDFPWSGAPDLVLPPGAGPSAHGFARATIDLPRAAVTLHHLDDNGTEYPRVDDRLVGRPHRYLTVAGRSGAPLAPGEHDRLYRYDMTAGTSVHVDAGAAIGEVVFAPRTGATAELDGYYLAFGTDLATDRSALYIWDAADVPGLPDRHRGHAPPHPQRPARQLVPRRLIAARGHGVTDARGRTTIACSE